jgi:peptide/nickel transport system substrate-binding protein
MRSMSLRRSLLALAALTALSTQAATLRIANQGDALSMDPHSLNEIAANHRGGATSTSR